MLIIKEAEYIKSVAANRDRPKPALPEFAFAGRSNVGKSSLINSVLNRQSIAKVSKSPGKTRNINYFLVNGDFYLVDLPGYGYAKVSAEEKNRWQRLIEGYLLDNRTLYLLFVLIDAKVGMKETDFQLLEWLIFERIDFQIVLTKADKINKNSQQKRRREIKQILPVNFYRAPILFSAKKKFGKDEILKIIQSRLTEVGNISEKSKIKSS